MHITDPDSLEGKMETEVREYSITPTTFASREFENDINDPYYQETYQYESNEITRFGINVLRFPIYILSLSHRLNTIDIEAVTQNDSTSENSSTVESGSRKSRSSNNKKQVVPPKYYQLEIDLLNKAIKYLLDDTNRKTVVVDILAQESGELKIKNGNIETHAILLYKNPTTTTTNIETKTDDLKNDNQSVTNNLHEIVVIDPSNSSYSAHLSNLTRANITHTNFSQISTVKKSIQIYTIPNSAKTGSIFNQYRDCIDIAVKLGFGFNQTEPSMYVDTQNIKQIKNLDVVKMITNQPKIDNNIIDPELVNRIKQTSYYKTIEVFNALENTIKQNLSRVLTKSDTEHDTIYNNHRQILQNENANKVILDQLLTCNKECIDILMIEHNSLMELVGEINDTDFGALS